MTLPEPTLERTLDVLLRTALTAPESLAEHRAARATFERGGPEDDLARRRADEWFVLERHNQALGGVPVELAMHGDLPVDDDVDEGALAALVSSITGVFEVTGLQPGEGVWVRDLLAFGEYPLEEPEGSLGLAHGDLLVGRLFPVGDGLHRVSRAAGVFRNPVLKAALVRDLQQARAARRGVLRLASPELERMFWGPLPPDERRCAAAARAVLVRGGLGGAAVEAIFARLAAAPFDGRPLPGADDVLGQVLAELAFDTQVDLKAARSALLELWPHLRRGQEPAENGAASAGAREGRPDARAAIENFDRGRQEGRDLGELFAELARDLELELDESEEEEDPQEAGAPDFPGVVGALVEEYLWELQRERGSEAARAQSGLRKLSVFAEPIGLFEELGARELLSFASLWLPEWGELSGADEARAVLRALRDFCDWAQGGQEVPLRSAYDGSLTSLEEALPRIAEANAARTARAEPSAGEWLAVLSIEGPAVVLEGARGGAETRPLPAGLVEHLRPGDLVRAGTVAGEFTVFCAYPAAARELTRLGRPSD